MIVKLRKFLRFFMNREFMIFVLIGIFNTLSGSVFATLYSMHVGANLAFVLGYLTSLVIAYLLNAKINFKKRITLKRFLKFAVSYIPNFIIQNIMVFLFYNHLGWDRIITYFLAAVIGVPVTFACMKLFAFKK